MHTLKVLQIMFLVFRTRENILLPSALTRHLVKLNLGHLEQATLHNRRLSAFLMPVS